MNEEKELQKKTIEENETKNMMYFECMINQSKFNEVIDTISAFLNENNIRYGEIWWYSFRYPKPLYLFPEPPVLKLNLFNVTEEQLKNLNEFLEKYESLRSFSLYTKTVTHSSFSHIITKEEKTKNDEMQNTKLQQLN